MSMMAPQTTTQAAPPIREPETPRRVGRLVKGSDEAKEHMQRVRDAQKRRHISDDGSVQ